MKLRSGLINYTTSCNALLSHYHCVVAALMAGEAKAGAGRPARTRAAESQVTDDASRGQPKRRPEAEPLPLPVTKPVRALEDIATISIKRVRYKKD